VGQFIVHLLRDIEKFLKNSNTPAARFGREAMGDPRFAFDLRNGREPRARTVERVRAFLETAQ
jgi:hypothetical protein